MELALYDPSGGYYAGGAQRLGRGGDFFTASDVGPAFGRSLAKQIQEVDRLIGPFDPFDVIEYGAGRGLLARDILESMAELDPDLNSRMRYLMVDRSEAMRRAASEAAPRARALAPQDLEGGYRGCILAVELFDALPVHRLRRRGGRLVEVYVGLDPSGGLVELEGEPSSTAADLAARFGAAAEEGSEAEVSPRADSQLDAMEGVLDHGVVIVFDYGYSAAELYSAERERGTLLAYHSHSTSESLLDRVGEQDLTAHVNFTALEERAAARGLEVLGLTTQDRFLIGNGIMEYFEQKDGASVHDPRRVKERLQAMQLIHPMGMGRIFKVLVLSKGCQPPPALSGLDDPF